MFRLTESGPVSLNLLRSGGLFCDSAGLLPVGRSNLTDRGLQGSRDRLF
jgi:hypothetical protein